MKMKPSQPPPDEGQRRCKSLIDQQVDSSIDLYAAKACVASNVELLNEMLEDLDGDTSAKGRGIRKKLRLSVESLKRTVIPKVANATMKLAPMPYLDAAVARIEHKKKKEDRKLQDITNAAEQLTAKKKPPETKSKALAAVEQAAKVHITEPPKKKA